METLGLEMHIKFWQLLLKCNINHPVAVLLKVFRKISQGLGWWLLFTNV